MTNTFPANIDRRELSQVSLICKIKRHVTLLAPESVGENSLQLKLLFLKAVLVGRRGKVDKGDGRCNRVKGPAPPSLHQVPTPKTCRGRPAPRAAAGPAPTQQHTHVRPAPARARAPRLRRRRRARARCSLPPRRSLRWDRGASRSPHRSTPDPRTRRWLPRSVGSGGRSGSGGGARSGAQRRPASSREAMSPGAGPCVRQAPRQAGR